MIKIGLTGQVYHVNDPCNLLENGVHQGDSITGFYIYDSSTLNSSVEDSVGIYEHTCAPYGMSLTIGGLTFQTDWTNVDLSMIIWNNYI